MSEKRCSTCHLVQPLSDLNKRAAAPDGLQPRCRSCSREWYRSNLDQHKANVRARNTRVRAEHAERPAACGLPWRRIEAEIAKCSVRCANCHRRRTAEMFGFSRQAAEQRRLDRRHAVASARLASVLGA